RRPEDELGWIRWFGATRIAAGRSVRPAALLLDPAPGQLHPHWVWWFDLGGERTHGSTSPDRLPERSARPTWQAGRVLDDCDDVFGVQGQPGREAADHRPARREARA